MSAFRCRQAKGGCGQDATWHVLWEYEDVLKNAMVCRSHRRTPRPTARAWVHPLGADCGMPGSRFDPELNDCFVPPEEVPPAFRETRELSSVG